MGVKLKTVKRTGSKCNSLGASEGTREICRVLLFHSIKFRDGPSLFVKIWGGTI